jgi:hypothetical protein
MQKKQKIMAANKFLKILFCSVKVKELLSCKAGSSNSFFFLTLRVTDFLYGIYLMPSFKIS